MKIEGRKQRNGKSEAETEGEMKNCGKVGGGMAVRKEVMSSGQLGGRVIFTLWPKSCTYAC